MAAVSVQNEVIEEDLPKAVQLLNTLTQQVAFVTSHVRELIKKVQNKTYPTSKGLSFLDLRYHLLLFYLQDVVHLMSVKANGQSLKDNYAIHRLVTIRTVLEKMRPLDQKLKYQIDKLMRTAVTGSLAENDPLYFRPNPENLVSKLDQSEESGDDSDDDDDDNDNDDDGNKKDSETKAAPKARKYVPPKIAPMHYDGDLTEADRQKELVEKRRKAAFRSSVIGELRQQYSDAPEEIRERQDFQTERDIREEQHRKKYEESMMVRLSVSRDQKAKKRRMMGMSSQLKSITHFGDITALTGGEAPDLDNPRPKKKKKLLKKNNKKRMFKKRK
ncbi:neuroguidin [Neoarius graeffei]|uniref:neuroguidin n=1 Tax=Neoarius graeffei TaxID=443677 RepID=UPI00298CF56C|nr:neuroguidin [Neoarius graeffei]